MCSIIGGGIVSTNAPLASEATSGSAAGSIPGGLSC
jgi:hypothetical protein